MVGAWKTWVRGSSTWKALRTREISWVARKEWPPMSKKLSVTPTCLSPRTSHQIWARVCSVGVLGATSDCVEPGRAALGGGRALRSSFPLGERGSAGKLTNVEGTE